MLTYNLITKFIDLATKGLIFILPLFFLPWTIINTGIDNFGKIQLLYFVVLSIIILQLLVILKTKRIAFRNFVYYK